MRLHLLCVALARRRARILSRVRRACPLLALSTLREVYSSSGESHVL